MEQIYPVYKCTPYILNHSSYKFYLLKNVTVLPVHALLLELITLNQIMDQDMRSY